MIADGRLAFVQAHQPAAGGIQVERLAVRGGQANELGGRLGQHASQRIGIGFKSIRPIAHKLFRFWVELRPFNDSPKGFCMTAPP